MPPMISLVVCTRNRAEQLGEALARANNVMASVDWELIVVDNGSTDDTPKVLRQFSEEYSGRLRILHEPRPGVSRAKNLGWRAAAGDVIALTDDDCYLNPMFIDRIHECFQDPELGYVGGRVLLYDPTDYPITIQELDERITLPPRGFIPAGLIHGANFSIRRSVLEAIDGFDVRLGPGTPLISEEVDVMARASALGWKGIYEPSVVVYHHHRRKSAGDARKLMRGYDLGRGAYYLKSILNPPISSVYLREWVRAITHQNPLRTLNELRGGLLYTLGLATELAART